MAKFTGTNHEGTVVAIDGFFDGPGRKAVAGVVLALFCAGVLGTLAWDTLRPAPAPKLMGREKDDEDARRAKTDWRDGTLTALIEYDLKNTSAARRFVMPRFAAALYRFLGEAKGAARVGRDGWFYLNEREDLLKRPAASMIDPAVAVAPALQRRFAARGTRLVVVPVPRKSEVYPENLPRSFDPRRELYPALVAGLEGRGLPVADLRRRFDAARTPALYYVLDSHWNEEGQRLAAEVVAETAGLAVPPGARQTTVRPDADKPDPGDVVKLIGLDPDAGMDGWVPRATSKRYAIDYPDGKPIASSTDVRPGAASRPTLAISGTSFTANSAFARFIRHATDCPVEVFAWPGAGSVEPLRRLAEAIAARPTAPDVVLWELQGHDVFVTLDHLPRTGGVFAELKPKTSSVLRDCVSTGGSAASFAPGGKLKPGDHALSGSRLSAWTLDGRVVVDARGAVGVRLRGSVAGKGTAEIVVGDNTPGELRAVWRPGLTEIVLPIVGVAPVKKVDVAVRASAGTAQLKLGSCDLVVDAGAAGSRPGTVAAAAVDGAGGFSQTVAFDAAANEGPRDVLVLKLQCDAKGPAAKKLAEKLRVELHGADGAPLVKEYSGVASDGLLVVGLDDLPGGRLRKVALSAAGGVDRQGIREAQVLTYGAPAAAGVPESRPTPPPASRPATRPAAPRPPKNAKK